jgi:predicted Ser/Thr protein kinase
MKTRRKKTEQLQDVQERGKFLENMLTSLSEDIRKKEPRIPLTFDNFLYEASINPEQVFRNIFQLFHDMSVHFIGSGEDEYETSEDSIGFVKYECNKLFVENCDDPFFADRLFANRFMNLVQGFKKGIQNNRIYLFEGPPGSGKSTFLNNLLHKFEDYTKMPEGYTYKTFWRIDAKVLGGYEFNTSEINHFHADNQVSAERYLEIECPCNDNPILQIPKEYRKQLLDELIEDKVFKKRLFTEKEFEWVFKEIPCSLCNSIFGTLLDKVSNPLEVFKMIYAKVTNYSRQFGRGISVYNPGDTRTHQPISNPTMQKLINELFKTDTIKYIYSDLAHTNNGILALMDIKEHNVERLMSLHGVISDGIHKVEYIEERVKTLFLGLVNPEDKLHYENVKSFQDRIINVTIPYVLDYNTEVAIYKNKFGDDISKSFLPRVLENFAKIVISTRLDKKYDSIKKWINPDKYKKHLDQDMFLLKMDIYTGKIPAWIKDDDIRRFDKEMRKDIIQESENEGRKGFSGRQSISLFGEFFIKYQELDRMIIMSDVVEFFEEKKELFKEVVSGEFIESLVRLYDYNVLQEVKEAIYHYNENQINNDITNYLFSINFEPGETIKNPYNGLTIDVTEDYFANFEAFLFGVTSSDKLRKNFRKEVQSEYVRKTLAQDIKLKKMNIVDTEQFKKLFDKYIQNLKENALLPYLTNDNFRRAISDYTLPAFNTYDNKLKGDVKQLIKNLKEKFNYSEKGACEICLYVLDKKINASY